MQRIQRFGAIGACVWLRLLLVGACGLHATAERAQGSQDTHHLIVQAGNIFHGDGEVDRFDGRAEILWQNGVQGVNPNFFVHHALADGDAGVLAISSGFSLAGGGGDPISVDGSNRSVARIEESVDPDFLSSGPVSFTAHLDWSGSGSLSDGNGEPSFGSVQAGLRVNQCAVGHQTTFYSSGFGEGTTFDSCSNTAHVTNTVSAGPGALSITQTMDGSALPTRFLVTVQIEGEANYLDYFNSGQYQASGTLSIDVIGVDYRFSSPTFLTVPEPKGVALGIAALAALGALGLRAAKES